MKIKNTLLVIFLYALLSSSFVSADVICVKNKVPLVNGEISLKRSVKRVTSSTCPGRHTFLMDLSNLVGETGDLPAAASGKTFSGTFATGGTATGVGDFSSDSITFPTKLASDPIPHVVEFGGPATTECPGSFSIPQALAGHLCIYVGDRSNVENHRIWDPISSNGEDASIYGAAMYAYATGAGRFYSWGTWAVTTN